jgi:hypothetical protein
MFVLDVGRNVRMTTMTIFQLLSEYHRRLDDMKERLDDDEIGEVERIGIADAWQAEMDEWFRSHGYCFACNRSLARCACGEPA